MTTIPPIAADASSPGAAQKTLAGNFNTFLTLLTAQLQNQDPLNPMDSNQFTQQLVEFSQVEQQINTNDNLKTLIALGQGRSASDAVGYLGKAVTLTNGKGALVNSAAQWNYVLGGNAANATLTVTNANGRVVFSGPAETTAGPHSFAWDGKDNGGNTLADGAYQLSVSATGADGASIATAVASAGVVTEVDLSGSEPLLMLGPLGVKLSEVSSVASL